MKPISSVLWTRFAPWRLKAKQHNSYNAHDWHILSRSHPYTKTSKVRHSHTARIHLHATLARTHTHPLLLNHTRTNPTWTSCIHTHTHLHTSYSCRYVVVAVVIVGGVQNTTTFAHLGRRASTVPPPSRTLTRVGNQRCQTVGSFHTFVGVK